MLRIDRWDEGQARIADRGWFHEFIRDIFTQRRKRLLGVLAAMFKTQETLPREQLEALFADLKIPPDARAEQLPVDTLVALGNRLHELHSLHLTPEA